MPPYGAREELGFLEQFLHVVFAEVLVEGRGGLVEGEDVVCGFEFGDGYEADLISISFGRVKRWDIGVEMLTVLLLLLAAFMRDVMLARFSVSCFARCGFICISSAIVVACIECCMAERSRRQAGVNRR
jgi:hypothetical protein